MITDHMLILNMQSKLRLRKYSKNPSDPLAQRHPEDYQQHIEHLAKNWRELIDEYIKELENTRYYIPFLTMIDHDIQRRHYEFAGKPSTSGSGWEFFCSMTDVFYALNGGFHPSKIDQHKDLRYSGKPKALWVNGDAKFDPTIEITFRYRKQSATMTMGDLAAKILNNAAHLINHTVY